MRNHEIGTKLNLLKLATGTLLLTSAGLGINETAREITQITSDGIEVYAADLPNDKLEELNKSRDLKIAEGIIWGSAGLGGLGLIADSENTRRKLRVLPVKPKQ